MLKKSRDKLARYVDPTGELPTRELKLAEWYLRHKLLISRIGLGALLAWCVITIGFSLWQWGEYLIVGFAEDERLAARQAVEFQNYAALQTRYRAAELTFDRVQVFRSGEDSYDFTAVARNPNQRWLAYLKYHFESGGEMTATLDTVLLPAADRPVAVFGQELKQFPGNASLVVDEIRWRRISPHQLADVEEYIKKRIAFSADALRVEHLDSAGAPVTSLSFELHNDSGYSYWRPVFYVELLNGPQTIGLIHFSTDKLKAAEKRPVALRYFGDPISITDIRLHPVVNVFDPLVYMEPAAGETSPSN